MVSESGGGHAEKALITAGGPVYSFLQAYSLGSCGRAGAYWGPDFFWSQILTFETGIDRPPDMVT